MAKTVADTPTNAGFTIECRDGETLLVSAPEAKMLFHDRNIEYFRNVFKHGTREADERVLKKPDWPLATAQRIVDLLTTKLVRVPVSDANEIVELHEAALQILFCPRAYYPVMDHLSSCLVDRQLQANLLKIFRYQHDHTIFSIRTRLCGLFWDLMLKQFVLVLKDTPGDNGFGGLTFGCRNCDYSEEAIRRKKCQLVHSRTYQALTPVSLWGAVHRIVKTMFIGHRKIAQVRHRAPFDRQTLLNMTEDLSIMIPVKYTTKPKPARSPRPERSGGDILFGVSFFEFSDLELSKPSQQKKQICDIVTKASEQVGVRGEMFRPKHSMRELPTFHGTTAQGLHQSLELFLAELSSINKEETQAVIPDGGTISLRVTAPTPETVKRLIDACCQCPEEDGKVRVEVDFYHQAYYVRRGVQGMTQLLDCMSKPLEERSESEPPHFILQEREKRHRY